MNRHWKLHLPPAEQSQLADRIAQNHARGEHALAVMEQRLSNSAWLVAGRYTDRRYRALFAEVLRREGDRWITEIDLPDPIAAIP